MRSTFLLLFLSPVILLAVVSPASAQIPEWPDGAFGPPPGVTSVSPAFKSLDGAKAAMGVEEPSDGFSESVAPGTIRSSNSIWAAKIATSKGKSWFVNKSPVIDQAAANIDSEAMEAECQTIARGLLLDLGFPPEQLHFVSTSTLMRQSLSPEGEPHKFVHGFMVEFTRQIDGIPVMDSRAYVRFDPDRKVVSWTIQWRGERPTSSLIKQSDTMVQTLLQEVSQEVSYGGDHNVKMAWIPVPNGAREPVLVPGYTVRMGRSIAGIPAVTEDSLIQVVARD